MTRTRTALVIVLASLAAAQCRDTHLHHLERGDTAVADGRMHDAVESYMAAIRTRPASGAAHFNLGYAYYEQGDFASAEAAFGAASTRLTGDERAHSLYNLANALARQARLREALAAYRASLRLRPDDDDARHNYVLVERWLEEQARDERRDRDDEQPAASLTPEQAARSLDALISGLRLPDRPAAGKPQPDW